MKKLISILALAALVVIPLQGAHAVNPPKAGENCPKEGLIQTAGNKKFTCIKLGTKLYWNNGVTVKKTNKSPISDLLKIPATCTVVLPEWSSIPQSVNAGAVSYSTLILNSSVSFSAVNILFFIDWYDRYGKVNS